MIRSLAAASAIALILSSSSWAQTPLSGKVPTTPPGKAAAQPVQQPPTQAAQVQPAATVPMSADSFIQALNQVDGNFPEMERPGAGGQIQEAWNVLDDPRQGVYVTPLCEDCVYKIRTREFMTTTITLPEDAVISSADLGDPTKFMVKVKSANKIAVRPSTYGIDTNLNVYTKAGAVYPFYLRAESYNSKHVPDLVVRIVGREKAPAIEAYAGEAGVSERQEKGSEPKPAPPGDMAAAAIHDLTNPRPANGDFVRNVPFDPSKLRGWKDYKLRGNDETMKPEVIYRDDFFTYIQYGEKFDVTSLPTAYVTIDGIDELVNTRVQGSTYIIESVNPLITLKNGKSYLCIQYTGEKP